MKRNTKLSDSNSVTPSHHDTPSPGQIKGALWQYMKYNWRVIQKLQLRIMIKNKWQPPTVNLKMRSLIPAIVCLIAQNTPANCLLIFSFFFLFLGARGGGQSSATSNLTAIFITNLNWKIRISFHEGQKSYWRQQRRQVKRHFYCYIYMFCFVSFEANHIINGS